MCRTITWLHVCHEGKQTSWSVVLSHIRAAVGSRCARSVMSQQKTETLDNTRTWTEIFDNLTEQKQPITYGLIHRTTLGQTAHTVLFLQHGNSVLMDVTDSSSSRLPTVLSGSDCVCNLPTTTQSEISDPGIWEVFIISLTWLADVHFFFVLMAQNQTGRELLLQTA